MKIDRIDLFKVPPRWLFLRIITNDGLEGWGEPVLEGRTDSVAGAVKDLEEYLIGSDPARIEDLFIILSKGGFYRGGAVMMSAISGIEQALWDIKGKALGVPVYQLMGGPVRDRIKVYVWVGGDEPGELMAQAAGRISSGYKALKINGTGKTEWMLTGKQLNQMKSRLAELRSITGDEVGIGIDFHGRIHKSSVKTVLKELEEFRPMFYEEPLLPEHSFLMKDLAAYTTVPLAAGERLIGRSEFRELITEGAVDILQPDISHAGGIWELRKIAAMAEASDIAVAPHCPLGPIAFAASLQLNACTPNVIIQESSLGIHYNEGTDLLDYVSNKEDFRVRDGFIKILPGPGLGVEIDEKFVLEMAKKAHNWRNPVWRAEDGSFIEW